jgi:cytochrome c oxidase cbb3-type subunit 4
MDIGTLHGLLTAILMAAFVALVIWAYSRGRHKDFTRAAALPLEDDDAPPRTEMR